VIIYFSSKLGVSPSGVDVKLPTFLRVVELLAATSSVTSHGVPFIPGPGDLPIVVRSCYRDLEQLILDIWTHPSESAKQRHVLVLGIPGIGKSLFLLYMLWVVLRRRHSSSIAVLFLRSTGPPGSTFDAFMIHASPHSVVVTRSARDVILWPRGVTERYSFADGCNPMDTEAAAALEVSSPQLPRYQYFQKLPGVQTVYMPGFSLSELFLVQKVRFPSLSVDVVRERYRILGGSAQLVLEHTESDPCSLIQDAFGRTPIDSLMRGIESNDITVSHRLLHFDVETDGAYPFRMRKPTFGSVFIRQEVAKQLKTSHRHYVSWLCDSLCDSSQMSNHLSKLRGRLFEDWVVQRFCEGGRFRWRLARASSDEPELYLFEPSTQLCEVDSAEEIALAPDHAVSRPMSPSFGGIDFIRQGRDLFNVTCDIPHGLSLSALTNVAALMRRGQQPLRFFWVVPRGLYTRMKAPQRFHDSNGHVVDEEKLPDELRSMEQYVLEVPLVDLQLLAEDRTLDDSKHLDDEDLALAFCGFAEPGQDPCFQHPVGGNRRCAVHTGKHMTVEALRSIQSKKRKLDV